MKLSRKRLYQLAVICFILAVIVFSVTYFLFHHVTDAGYTPVKQAEAGKPFVTELVGMLGVELLAASIFTALFAGIVLKP